MTTYFPPKKGVAYVAYISLVSQANTKIMQSNPTIASGDFKVSIDGGALANLTTLPSVAPASSKMVVVSLSTSEMNGDNITIVCSDAAGAEWCDLVLNLQTTARQIDDLAYPATSGRSMVVDASGLVDANTVKVGPTGSGTAQTARDVGASVLLSSGTGTGQLDFTSGVVKANLAQILGTVLTETSGQIAAAFIKFFNKATPTGTVNSLPDAVAGATGGVFIAGTNAATTVTTALTTTFTGSVTGNVGGNVTGSVGSIASGGIAASSFAAGAIDAAAIAADAIGSSELAASAVNEIADQVWDELLSGHAISGSAGAALSSASSAGDPWSTALPGAYGAGTAGKIIGDNIDATISSRASQTSVDTVDDFLDTEVAAIKAKTDNLPASPAAVGSAMTLTTGERTSVADALLDRDMATGTDSSSNTVRTLRSAVRKIRNKYSISGSTGTVTKEDDTTTAYTEALTTSPTADPVTGWDPA